MLTIHQRDTSIEPVLGKVPILKFCPVRLYAILQLLW